MPLQLSAEPGRVWRVGFRPNPWDWTDWRHAHGRRFQGRWDDQQGNFRTVYAGATLFACLLELLAKFRRDAALAAELDAIDDDPAHPHRPAAAVAYSWLEPRVAATATLAGRFCDVTATASLAELYPHFIVQAIQLGLSDFDAAALRDSGVRDLTRAVASWLYDQTDPTIDGVAFESRHGDGQHLWAIFERPDSGSRSPLLTDIELSALTPELPELAGAFELLGLTWEG